MKTCHEIRKNQLRALVEEVGGVSRLSEIIGRTDTQIRQWLNASKDSRTGKPRGIADEMARFIEESTGKPIGWMDNDPSLAGVPGWFDLTEIQQAQVVGFIQGLLMQNRAGQHGRPYIDEGEESLRGQEAPSGHTRKAS
jgi:hypothetical protein